MRMIIVAVLAAAATAAQARMPERQSPAACERIAGALPDAARPDAAGDRARTYYVDRRCGSDENDGASPATAWRTIDRVNDHSFRPGDRILFRRGDVYREMLRPRSSGAKGNPIEFGAYGAGASPLFEGDGSSELIRLRDVAYLRISDLDVNGGERGISLHDVVGVELVDVDVYGNSRDGIYIGDGSHHNRVKGGSSHHNGEVDARISPKTGKPTNLGHGVLISSDAHHNLVEDMRLYANAEDGVQFGPSAGDDNVIESSRMYGNLEDGVDIKAGNQILAGNMVYGNVENAVLVHQKADTITLTGNNLKTVTGANALDVRSGARVISSGNHYEGVNSQAVELASSAGDRSSFRNDTFVDGGRKVEISVDVSGGSGHIFEDVSFIMRNPGAALAVRGDASDVTVRNSAFYTSDTPVTTASEKVLQTSNVTYRRAD